MKVTWHSAAGVIFLSEKIIAGHNPEGKANMCD